MDKPFNLFVYGTLMNATVFRAVLGKRLVLTAGDADGVDSFRARDAVLDGYKKISPDRTYMYAVPDPHSRIRGYLIGPMPGSCMEALRKYEGRNYSRKTLRVHAKEGYQQAVVFVGNLRRMEHSFGYPFRDPLKQEILLREKIEAALLEAEREQLHTDESVARRALGELHGAAIRDLVRRHFEAGGISDYAISRALKASRLRDFTRIAQDPRAEELAPNYLSMVIRQVIFNQLEEKIRQDFRYELDRMDPQKRYYERAGSSLAALRILNSSPEFLRMLCADCLGLHGADLQKSRLVEYVRWAVVAADSIYDAAAARLEIERITAKTGGGAIPLGAELEFSNTGHDVIRDPEGRLGGRPRDRQYDGMLYFPDYALDVLTWKLGGHIDDHHEKASDRPRRGFFETALGSISVELNLSKPISADPWLLGELVRETMGFYDILPHSLHISLQLRSQHRPAPNRLLPLYAIKCLLAIAGDARIGPDGRLEIRRITSDEIVRTGPAPSMLFSDISKRHSADSGEAPSGGASGRYVQQFKFLRLSPDLDYEPIIVGLKGIQLSLRPGSFLTPQQYKASRKHREMFAALMDWGRRPREISEPETMAFLGHVYDGLLTEKHGRPAHPESYIALMLSRLRAMIHRFNGLVKKAEG
ncbi:MAG: gamma-glutamylcyclotransferase family protein [Phycisphaerae bacterium]